MHAVTYEHGLHLRGSPLWFDAERQRELCILTSCAYQLPPLHRRMVASTDMAAALERAGYTGSVLPTPWGRWVGVGGHRVQLLDAHSAPGCAAALVLSDGAPLLVTGDLRVQPVAWPRASHVVARLPALRHSGLPMAQVAQQVAAAIDAALSARRRVTVWVDAMEVGLALHKALLELGMSVKPLGLLGKLVASAPVVGRNAYLSLSGSQMHFDANSIRVSSGVGDPFIEADAPGAPPVTKLRWFADLPVLQNVLTQSRARRVSLIDVPPASEDAVCAALGPGTNVRFLSDARQLPLGARLSSSAV